MRLYEAPVWRTKMCGGKPQKGRRKHMSLVYGIISLFALILAGVCILVDEKKEKWLLLLFISVFVCDLGYFLISISKTLAFALMANRIAYLGRVFLPFFMFMKILNLCGLSYRKWLPGILAAVSGVVLIIAASPGFSTVYYSTVSIEFSESLINSYLFLYFGAMLLVIGWSAARNRLVSRVYGVFLLCAVFINIAVWFIEQLIPRGFEALSVSYLLSEALLLFLQGAFQKYNIRQRVICVWTAAFACVCIALLCKAAPEQNPAYYFLNIIRCFIYIGMYYAWGRIVYHGIIQKTVRRCLEGISLLLILWIVINNLKQFVFQDNITAARYLWYACCIPQLLIAVLSLITGLMAGKGENAKAGKWSFALLGATILMILLVMTNDLHQLVFSFPRGAVRTSETCTHEAAYYFIMLFIALCGAGGLVLLTVKCRVPRRKRFVGFQFLVLLLIAVYWRLYYVEGSFVALYLNDRTAVSCVLIAALFESLIESGLLQTNIGYDNLFQSSSLAVQITDYAHQVLYASQRAQGVSVKVLEEADRAPVMLDESTRLAGAEIRGGHIYWQEDVSELIAVQEELEMTQAELRDTGDVLKAESEQKAYRLHLEEKNRLYDLVEVQTASQVAMLRELTGELRRTQDLNTAKRLLGKIVIIGTYIKRRSNLIFVAGQEESIRCEELLLCIRESAENLKLYGVECGVRILGCERLSPQAANTAYDLFEAVIEKGLNTVSAVFLCVEPEKNGLFVNICADCTEDLTQLCQSFSRLTVGRDEDSLWYLNLELEKGGACA